MMNNQFQLLLSDLTDYMQLSLFIPFLTTTYLLGVNFFIFFLHENHPFFKIQFKTSIQKETCLMLF